MWKPLIPAAIMACVAVSPLYANHRDGLPWTAPLPQPRPAVEAKQDRVEQPLPISISPQQIPEARLNVRLIGPGFPPPSAREFDFTADRGDREPAMVWFVEHALTATVRGSWRAKADTSASMASAE